MDFALTDQQEAVILDHPVEHELQEQAVRIVRAMTVAEAGRKGGRKPYEEAAGHRDEE